MEVSVLVFVFNVISLKCLCDSDTLNVASPPSRQARGQRGIMGSRYLDNAWSPSVFGFHVSLSRVLRWSWVCRRSVGCEQRSSDCLSAVKCVCVVSWLQCFTLCPPLSWRPAGLWPSSVPVLSSSGSDWTKTSPMSSVFTVGWRRCPSFNKPHTISRRPVIRYVIRVSSEFRPSCPSYEPP